MQPLVNWLLPSLLKQVLSHCISSSMKQMYKSICIKISHKSSDVKSSHVGKKISKEAQIMIEAHIFTFNIAPMNSETLQQ